MFKSHFPSLFVEFASSDPPSAICVWTLHALLMFGRIPPGALNSCQSPVAGRVYATPPSSYQGKLFEIVSHLKLSVRAIEVL